MTNDPVPEDVRWLTPEEREAWLALLSLALRMPQAIDAQLSKDAGLSHFEYGVLSGLSEAPDRTLRMSTLAGRAEGSLPRLSQVVTRLEKRGFVERTPDPSDGRYTLATLTQAGWSEVQRVAPMHVEHVRHLVFDQLTKAQVRQLTAIGRRIMGTVRPDDRFLGPDA